MSTKDLSYKFSASHQAIWRTLWRYRFNKRKLIWKLGLTEPMKAARLQFALEHKDWTLEDWKNVI